MNDLNKLSPQDVEALHSRVHEYGGFSPRELAIYMAGQDDGKNLKADEIQPRLAGLELAVQNHRILFVS